MSHKRIALLLCAVLVFGIVLHVGPMDSLIERTRSDENPVVLNDVTFTNIAHDIGLGGVGGSFMSWGDYDNDGYQDLLINGRRLFRNSGPPAWNFTDVTSQSGLTGGVGNGVWGDYDNDGWLDLYSGAGQNSWDILWRNNGNGTFTNVTVAAGNVYDNDPTSAAGWGDYDGDGFLDLYVANGEDWNGGNPIYYPDILYHNNGNGTFTDVTVSAGIDDYTDPAYGRGVAWADFDDDGDLDAYISNYRLVPNYLWLNNGNGTFTEAAFDRGVAGVEHWYAGDGPYYGHTIGSSWADVNNDGYLDLFTANLAHKDNVWPWIRGYICDDSRLYLNSGPPAWNFTDIRNASGIPIIPPGTTHGLYYKDELFSNAAFADYDNDGDMDLWIVQVYDPVQHAHSFLYSNSYADNGTVWFTNVTGIADVMVWNTYAGAWADYDNDGDLDLVSGGKNISTEGETHELRFFQNNGNSNSWLKVQPLGCPNRYAIGGKVYVTHGSTTQLRQVEAGMGSHSQMNSLPLEFGFGSYYGTVNVTVVWPSGESRTLVDVSLNRTVYVAEPSCAPAMPANLEASLEGPQMNDVRLDWNLSADDGAGKDNVASYPVYHSTTYNKNGDGYQPLAEVPSGTSTYVHASAGNGDSNSYFYFVGARYHVGEPAPSETFVDIDPTQIAKYGRFLPAGKHFVSLPIVPEDASTESVFATLSYDTIIFWDRLDHADHWKRYSSAKLYDRDLTAVEPGRGYWINVTSDSFIEFIGIVPGNTSIMLYKGWNMIGYASYVDRSVESVFQGLPLLQIEGFDITAHPYGLRRLDSAENMLAGEAYWVRVDGNSLLTVEN
ncbi:MAG: CRTAC1 family protein [Candidatus Thermoplasmatota archaeon]|nr:CRTAC1 family protein [Candidatus Thermoplasmatota archaeon]